ncbi:hypothetical protein [Rhodoblastus sp.]|uniref:hypothetical protein n=1 Tax=Rhodoblastus sp. TaxID=1962975 RepID=UPI003F9966C8
MTLFEPSRASGTAFVAFAAFFLAGGAILFTAGGAILFTAGGAWAQAPGVEERGVSDKSPESGPVNDQAFDCPAFKQTIATAGAGFAALRGESRSDDETKAIYGVSVPLFGTCAILEKKKLNEISYSCQADKLSLADLKATVEACLGDDAHGMASNENPNTPYLRYNPQIGSAKAQVMVLATFGKKTLVIFNPK